MRLPVGFDWDKCMVRIPENNAERIPEILSRISEGREASLREECYKAYQHYSGENFVSCIRTRLDHESA
jgi:hypothetical protein